MYIIKLASFFIALSLVFTNALADPQYQCPSVAQIQTTANDTATELKINCVHNDCTVDFNRHVIGEWYFFMNVLAGSNAEAKSKALETLKSLVYQSGPTFETRIYYICRYSNDAGYEAKALFYDHGH